MRGASVGSAVRTGSSEAASAASPPCPEGAGAAAVSCGCGVTTSILFPAEAPLFPLSPQAKRLSAIVRLNIISRAFFISPVLILPKRL